MIVVRLAAACLVLLPVLGTGCAAPPAPPVAARSVPFLLVDGARFSAVEVVADEALGASDRRRLESGADRVARQAVLDWLDQYGHFAREGEYAVEVRVRALSLRSAAATVLLGRLGGRDHLAAGVVVTRAGEVVKTYAVAVDSALGGWEWRRAGERLERLARLLGRRVFEGL